jgi:hypothetical protein
MSYQFNDSAISTRGERMCLIICGFASFCEAKGGDPDVEATIKGDCFDYPEVIKQTTTVSERSGRALYFPEACQRQLPLGRSDFVSSRHAPGKMPQLPCSAMVQL